ncbi:hypothetical protein Glove_33g34 [Diversispora epigaea]|uniref:Uncharacterized protein n=1 Tax=Diversispora epigaea TaxID=1348612 RepID=A0A397JH68_9GLOM|nr:hypothetical protein Glove_33g34 [Diversispora epigaea]
MLTDGNRLYSYDNKLSFNSVFLASDGNGYEIVSVLGDISVCDKVDVGDEKYIGDGDDGIYGFLGDISILKMIMAFLTKSFLYLKHSKFESYVHVKIVLR